MSNSSPEYSGLCPMLMVFDMQRSLHFYCSILGFEIHQSAGPAGDIGWVWLTGNDCNLMLNTLYELQDRPAQADPVRNDHHADTCLYFGCKDVDSMYTYLREKGWNVEPPNRAPYGMYQLYLKDPDGYNLCFQASYT